MLGLQFLVAGAREYDEPGVLVTFEKSAGKITANVALPGFDLDGLQRDGLQRETRHRWSDDQSTTARRRLP
jgi:KaiC/GvpD/RAD55 family RecA-like ATPase